MATSESLAGLTAPASGHEMDWNRALSSVVACLYVGAALLALLSHPSADTVLILLMACLFVAVATSGFLSLPPPLSSSSSRGGETQLLLLAVFCCLIVAAYQVVNFYLGHKLQQRVDESRTRSTGEIKSVAEAGVQALGAGDATQFVGGRSVVEGTTQLLEPLPRKAKGEE